MIDLPVLVLNQNYLPLNVCPAKRAIVLIFQGKAEMVEDGVGEIRTAYAVYTLPSVIRLGHLVHRPRPQRRLTRLQVFIRDQFTCQYCGRATHSLTLDHVTPRHRGGKHTWENVVSACIPCNHRKAGRTPQEAVMRLVHLPRMPQPSSFFVPPHQMRIYPQWQKFLPQ